MQLPSDIDDKTSEKISKIKIFKDEKNLRVINLKWLQDSRQQKLRKIELNKVNGKRKKITYELMAKTEMQKMANDVLSSIYCH
jgi:hypothetical protein